MSSPLIPNFHYICGVDSMISGMNFTHHISRGFRDIGGGYTPSITHTMAHELGHGLFGLDHIFSGAYGIKKGATYNLMDYTEKTPNDALSYHEWTQINLPLPNWSALSRAEEDMWDYAYAAKPRMTEVFRNNIYNVAINTIFRDFDDLRTCLLRFPDNTFGSNEFSVFTALKEQCEDELCKENLFPIALIAGIIHSGLVHRYTVPKMYLKGTQNGRYIIEKYSIRTSFGNSMRFDVGNISNFSVYYSDDWSQSNYMRVAYSTMIRINPNDFDTGRHPFCIAGTDCFGGNSQIQSIPVSQYYSREEWISVLFIHELIHKIFYTEPIYFDPITFNRIDQDFNANCWLQKPNNDAAIQVGNFVMMYLYRIREGNNPTNQGPYIRTTLDHHQRLQDSSGIVQNQDNDGGGNQYIEGYDLSPTELIDLPNGIFNKLNNDFYLNYVRPFVPQRYQDSKYGYR